MTVGKIILLPMPIGPESQGQFVTDYYLNIVKSTQNWVVESARTTRRFISSLKLGIEIESLNLFELDKNSNQKTLQDFLNSCILNGNIAVTSEAGLPGMADPGSEVAKWAHENEIEVEPITGPGSVYLSLCASGFNGQQFVFHGYCPIKEPDLVQFLKRIELHCRETGYSQIFIETPYRNNRLLEYIIKVLPKETLLCISIGLHTETGSIKTKTIAEWDVEKSDLGKIPAVYIIGQ